MCFYVHKNPTPFGLSCACSGQASSLDDAPGSAQTRQPSGLDAATLRGFDARKRPRFIRPTVRRLDASQDLEISLSTCTEPCLKGPIAAPFNTRSWAFAPTPRYGFRPGLTTSLSRLDPDLGGGSRNISQGGR